MSRSDTWRKEGNGFFAKATVPGLSPVLAINLFQKALNCYYRADETATTSNEKASAQKNYALTMKRVSLLKIKDGKSIKDVHFSHKTALEYYRKCLSNGQDKDKTWQRELESSAENLINSAIEYYKENTKGKERALLLEEVAAVLARRHCKGKVYYEIAWALYSMGVEAMESEDFKTCLSLTKDCYFPLEEADQMLKDNDTKTDVAVLREDVYLLTCMAESVQARSIGDGLLQKMLRGEEELNMATVLIAMDCYNNAIVVIRGKEIGLEAAATSRLGRIHGKLLKMKMKGKELYLRSISLALASAPRSFEGDDWFKEAKRFVEECQEEERQKEEAKWENVRKKYMGELEKELKELEGFRESLKLKNSNYETFLRSIYTTFPPKDKKQNIYEGSSPWDGPTTRRAYMKALTHYHPDKIDTDKLGAKWKILCEEITKVLTPIYMKYKV